MQQDIRREAWSAPARRKIAPGQAKNRQDAHHASSYLKAYTNAASTAACQLLDYMYHMWHATHPSASTCWYLRILLIHKSEDRSELLAIYTYGIEGTGCVDECLTVDYECYSPSDAQ
jgi:hypothetical protein